jgi:hypothetical protein
VRHAALQASEMIGQTVRFARSRTSRAAARKSHARSLADSAVDVLCCVL